MSNLSLKKYLKKKKKKGDDTIDNERSDGGTEIKNLGSLYILNVWCSMFGVLVAEYTEEIFIK